MRKLLLLMFLGSLLSCINKPTSPAPTDDERLGNFTLLLMDIVNADLSPMRRQILARTVVRVTGEIFTDYRHREAFIGLIAHESHFSAAAKSPKGATGIGQLMPSSAPYFAKLCGLNDFRQTDLQDVELNLYLGACFYRDLLEKLHGNTTAAEVAYNGGEYSDSLKSLLAQHNIQNTETSNYATAISYKVGEAQNTQEQIEKSMVESKQTISADLAINDLKSDKVGKLIKLSFSVKNTNEKINATGSVIVIGTFRLSDTKEVVYLSSPPVIGITNFTSTASDLNKFALPFSMKKVKSYEMTLAYPKNIKGEFESIKIVATDTRTGGQTSLDVSLPK